MAITPIPSTRVSDLFVRQRLVNQLNSDQIDLARLQTQISTGRRIILPSDDPSAALRAISLQQLLERKEQVQSNLTTNQSFLAATDSSLSAVSGLLASIRGTALSVSDSTSSDTERAAAAQEVERAIQQFVDTGNQKFRGRYLFAGSRTSEQPFELRGDHVLYRGNQGDLSSYSDIDLLFKTNADGDSVFGAISQAVEGTVDLNPVLRANTRLADLRGGQGISKGSIAISDGTQISIVDLGKAETIGDVAAMIRANPPQGRVINVSITPTGLKLQLDAAGGGVLTIKEVGGGTTASELGIRSESGIVGAPVIGTDLEPRLLSTTSLYDILGSSATATISSGGANNDFQIEARGHGAAFNDVTVSFVNNPAIAAGSETVVYDDSNPLDKKLIFQVNGASTTANNLIAALNNDPVAGNLFRASLVDSDSSLSLAAGTGLINPVLTATTAGGSGTDFDRNSGIRITIGGATHTLAFTDADTIQDVVNKINSAGAGVLAEINDQGTGINVRSRLSGADFSIGENGGSTAAQLGLRSFTTATRLEDLNHGIGVHSSSDADFRITRPDGSAFDIAVGTAQTIGDVIDLINNAPLNADPLTKVTARLSTVAGGIELVTDNNSSTTPFRVTKLNSSQAAQDLGLLPIDADQSAAAVVSGSTLVIGGRDTNPLEVNGIFNSLIRLHDALVANDSVGIQRSIALLDGNTLSLNLSRAEIGARQQGLDILKSRLDDEVISLKESLSTEIDTDVPQAISDLMARQAALQASLQLTGSISRLTLLDFL